jgi:hypothetical protein
LGSILRNFKGDHTRIVKSIRALASDTTELGDGLSSSPPIVSPLPQPTVDSSAPDFH